MSHSEKILVVDDEAEVRQLIRDALEMKNYTVHEAASVAQLWQAIRRFGEPDLIILDLNLPDGDGIEAAQHLRVKYSIPMIMLSGRGETIDRVLGLESGADDYMSKPFDLRELQARIKTVLRRTSHVAQKTEAAIYTFDDWRYETSSWTLSHETKGVIALTQMEASLLHLFLENHGRALNRQELSEKLGGRDHNPLDRSIDNLVSRLRKKLTNDTEQQERIRSVRNVGYQFLGDVERTEQEDAVS